MKLEELLASKSKKEKVTLKSLCTNEEVVTRMEEAKEKAEDTIGVLKEMILQLARDHKLVSYGQMNNVVNTLCDKEYTGFYGAKFIANNIGFKYSAFIVKKDGTMKGKVGALHLETLKEVGYEEDELPALEK